MTDRDGPDYAEILRSPYDEDPGERKEGESELGWKVPVTAAVLGALLVSAYVVFALVVGPDGTDEAASTASSSTTTSTLAEPVKQVGLPDGFVSVADDVGMRVESMHGENSSWVSVSTATTGAIDSALVAPIDIAYWTLTSVGNGYPAFRQLREQGALGNVSVEFGDLPQLPDAVLLATPVESEFTREVEIDLPGAEVPQEIVGERIDLGGGGVVVIESLVVADGWGHVRWRTEGFTPAKVEVVATFTGTDDPATPDVVDATVVASPHLARLRQGSGAIPLPPLYGAFADSQLVRSGEPLSNANPYTGISVSIRVTVPERLGEPAELPVPQGS